MPQTARTLLHLLFAANDQAPPMGIRTLRKRKKQETQHKFQQKFSIHI